MKPIDIFREQAKYSKWLVKLSQKEKETILKMLSKSYLEGYDSALKEYGI